MIRKAHCLFEQSGTFKKAFKAEGIEAFDYDILNDLGETDVQIDLFEEIKKGAVQEKSIFDSFDHEDLIFAFFPCTYFCSPSELAFKMKYQNYSKLPDFIKFDLIKKRNVKRAEYFELFTELFCICSVNKLKIIVENPYTPGAFLRQTSPLFPPQVIDENRNLHGDYYKKPTAFWFFNFEPQGRLENMKIYAPQNNRKRL